MQKDVTRTFICTVLSTDVTQTLSFEIEKRHFLKVRNRETAKRRNCRSQNNTFSQRTCHKSNRCCHNSHNILSRHYTTTITIITNITNITIMKYTTPTIIILYALFALVALSFQDSCRVRAKKGDKNVIKKQAITTVSNLDADDVSPEETDFFDDAWLTAFNSVYMNGDLTALAVQMKDNKMHPVSRRSLRVLPYFNYFVFYVTIDFGCRFCPNFRRTLKPNSKSESKKQGQVQALHKAFERTLCDILREGPHDVYRDVRNCQVTFADN
jgi:hypothetical protein